MMAGYEEIDAQAIVELIEIMGEGVGWKELVKELEVGGASREDIEFAIQRALDSGKLKMTKGMRIWVRKEKNEES